MTWVQKWPNLLFQFQLFHLQGGTFTEVLRQFLFFNQNPSHQDMVVIYILSNKIIILLWKLPLGEDYGFSNIVRARIFCQEYLREEFYFRKKILTWAISKSLLIMSYHKVIHRTQVMYALQGDFLTF